MSIESGCRTKYELLNEESFQDLISFANGLSLNADTNNVVLKRVSRGSSKVIDVDFDEIASLDVNNGDGLFIREFKFNSVKINGAVKNPGTYILPMGTKLSKLIEDAGGYESTAYPFGGFLNNKKSLDINKASKERLYDKFLNNLIIRSTSQGVAIDENFGLMLEKLRESPVSGRVIAEFDMDVLSLQPDLDTILEDGDEILIPNITQQVFVQGEISNPGAIRYSPNMDISFYIKNAGGALDSADLKNIFIVHPNGETTNLASNYKNPFMIFDGNKELIYPGSIIYVPMSSNLATSLETAAIWAPIISSLALSITSLSVLSNSN